MNARALIEENHPQQAIEILEALCQVDVEYLEAYKLLALTKRRFEKQKNADLSGNIYALSGENPFDESIPEWAVHLRGARQARLSGNFDRAHDLIHRTLPANPLSSLCAVTHLQILAATQYPEFLSKSKTSSTAFYETSHLTTTMAIRSLAEAYHDRWPSCSQITLLLAQALIDCNEDDAAVSLIHLAASQDVIGQVATRLWSPNHIYQTLWPDNLSVIHDQPIPAAVAACLGWNQLPITAGNIQPQGCGVSIGQVVISTPCIKDIHTNEQTSSQPSQHPASPLPHAKETLRSVQDELNKLAFRIKQPGLTQIDGRFPIYVIFTTLSGLELQYGVEGAAAIESEMKRPGHTVKQTMGSYPVLC
jgi:hypothetical protein